MGIVIDTNVVMVAEGCAQQADERCVEVCSARLQEIMQRGGLFLDQDDEIVTEYARNIGFAGQPGFGRAFVKWAWDYRYDSRRIKQFAITERAVDWRKYEEFPDRQDLSTFDQSDQKFVAVAVASGENPPILNAVDSDWWYHRVAFSLAGINVDFLCPQHVPPRSRPSRP